MLVFYKPISDSDIDILCSFWEINTERRTFVHTIKEVAQIHNTTIHYINCLVSDSSAVDVFPGKTRCPKCNIPEAINSRSEFSRLKLSKYNGPCSNCCEDIEREKVSEFLKNEFYQSKEKPDISLLSYIEKIIYYIYLLRFKNAGKSELPYSEFGGVMTGCENIDSDIMSQLAINNCLVDVSDIAKRYNLIRPDFHLSRISITSNGSQQLNRLVDYLSEGGYLNLYVFESDDLKLNAALSELKEDIKLGFQSTEDISDLKEFLRNILSERCCALASKTARDKVIELTIDAELVQYFESCLDELSVSQVYSLLSWAGKDVIEKMHISPFSNPYIEQYMIKKTLINIYENARKNKTQIYSKRVFSDMFVSKIEAFCCKYILKDAIHSWNEDSLNEIIKKWLEVVPQDLISIDE